MLKQDFRGKRHRAWARIIKLKGWGYTFLFCYGDILPKRNSNPLLWGFETFLDGLLLVAEFVVNN